MAIDNRRLWRSRLIDLLLAIAAGAFDLVIFASRTEDAGLRPGGQLPTTAGIVILLIGPTALLFRRRRPMPVFVICWAAAMSSLVFPELQPFGALLVAMFTVASRSSRQGAVLSLVATAGVFAVEVINTFPVGRNDMVGFWLLGTVITDVLILAAVWVAARLRHRTRRRLAELELLREQEIRAAVRHERLAMSRELHDIVSHSVSAMTLQAAGALAVMGQQPGRVRPALDAIEQSGIQAMNELQRLLELLRSEDESVETPSARARLSELPALIDRARQAGQAVELVVTGQPCDLDPSVEMTCYRLVQEALNNAVRHAGEGARVQVNLDWIPPRLRASVINDGGTRSPGHKPALSTGHGLAGLAERVHLVGGELETGALPDGGFAIKAVLPASAGRPT
ncbi:hypothetical protein FOE78_23090 [Microlunatus elymi]|uniref:histidine kinase n=1 Tax=Microlunatus elymi TaxID=2596828 RepID=A0A516Q4Q9_9ACTN|nr:histidine kinase [Microlunatus elymi]QDP98404.1 hypothetical protein FOE78_23090 [Microlunatus elymi]